MKRCISLLLLPLISCGQKQYTAAECSALATPEAFLSRCMGGKINGDYIGDLKCWPFSEPQRLHGVLRVGFEASEFYAKAKTSSQIANAEPKIWFEPAWTQHPPKALQGPPDGLTHTFLVEAVGRLSLCDGWFGHLGQYPREFIVSRVISAKPLSG